MNFSRHLKLRIEVDVLCNGQPYVAPHIAAAMLELVNRRDFKDGSIKQGRALTHRIDHGDMLVTVDIFRQGIDPNDDLRVSGDLPREMPPGFKS